VLTREHRISDLHVTNPRFETGLSPKPRLQHPFLPENWIFAIRIRQLRSLKLSNLNNTVPDL
jgi:hypothetical protein